MSVPVFDMRSLIKKYSLLSGSTALSRPAFYRTLLLLGMSLSQACTSISKTAPVPGSSKVENPPAVIKTTREADAQSNTVPSDNAVLETMLVQAADLIEQKEYIKANRMLNRALNIDSRYAATYYQLARLHLGQENPDKARQFVRRGLSLSPNNKVRQQLETLSNSLANN